MQFDAESESPPQVIEDFFVMEAPLAFTALRSGGIVTNEGKPRCVIVSKLNSKHLFIGKVFLEACNRLTFSREVR